MSTTKTIMLVDDQLDLRTLVRMTLEDPSIRIVEAANGEDAINMARELSPDLLLLDWMMPGRTGLEVAETLRNDPQTCGIPIVMLTSRNQPADIDRANAAGVHAHLTKPFSPLELLQTVGNVL